MMLITKQKVINMLVNCYLILRAEVLYFLLVSQSSHGSKQFGDTSFGGNSAHASISNNESHVPHQDKPRYEWDLSHSTASGYNHGNRRRTNGHICNNRDVLILVTEEVGYRIHGIPQVLIAILMDSSGSLLEAMRTYMLSVLTGTNPDVVNPEDANQLP